MPKWSKDAKEFDVNVHYSDDKGTQIRIPKPLLEKLGRPDKVRFVIDGKTIKIVPVKKSKHIDSETNKILKKYRTTK